MARHADPHGFRKSKAHSLRAETIQTTVRTLWSLLTDTIRRRSQAISNDGAGTISPLSMMAQSLRDLPTEHDGAHWAVGGLANTNQFYS